LSNIDKLRDELTRLKEKYHVVPSEGKSSVIDELDALLKTTDCMFEEIEAIMIEHLEITGTHDDVLRIMHMAAKGFEAMTERGDTGPGMDKAHVETVISILQHWLRQHVDHTWH